MLPPSVKFRGAEVNKRKNQEGATYAVCLLARGGSGLGCWDSPLASRFFLRKPKVVVFSGPVKIDGAAAHRLEGALHADGADVNVSQHRSDEQHRDDTVDDLGILHRLDRCSVEREDQHITADRHRYATEHHNPIDQLLASVETLGRRMVLPDNTAATPQPFDIDPVRNIAAEPHQEDQDDAERERETKVIMGILRPFR